MFWILINKRRLKFPTHSWRGVRRHFPDCHAIWLGWRAGPRPVGRPDGSARNRRSACTLTSQHWSTFNEKIFKKRIEFFASSLQKILRWKLDQTSTFRTLVNRMKVIPYRDKWKTLFSTLDKTHCIFSCCKSLFNKLEVWTLFFFKRIVLPDHGAFLDHFGDFSSILWRGCDLQ